MAGAESGGGVRSPTTPPPSWDLLLILPHLCFLRVFPCASAVLVVNQTLLFLSPEAKTQGQTDKEVNPLPCNVLGPCGDTCRWGAG